MEQPVTVVKIGSTTLSLLSAMRLSAPIKREQAVLHLIRRTPEDAAAAVRRQVEAWSRDLGALGRFLAGGGQVLRERPELLQQMPWPVWAPSGHEEARLAWLAVAAATREESPLVVDIGGGSTELVSSRVSYSLPIGVGRAGQFTWPEAGLSGRVTLVGGLGHVLGILSGHGPGEPISARAVARLGGEIRKQSTAELVGRGVGADRAPLVPRGLEILSSLLATYGWDSLAWADRGLLEGLWLAASLGRGRQAGPRLDHGAVVCQDRK